MSDLPYATAGGRTRSRALGPLRHEPVTAIARRVDDTRALAPKLDDIQGPVGPRKPRADGGA